MTRFSRRIHRCLLRPGPSRQAEGRKQAPNKASLNSWKLGVASLTSILSAPSMEWRARSPPDRVGQRRRPVRSERFTIDVLNAGTADAGNFGADLRINGRLVATWEITHLAAGEVVHSRPQPAGSAIMPLASIVWASSSTPIEESLNATSTTMPNGWGRSTARTHSTRNGRSSWNSTPQ